MKIGELHIKTPYQEERKKGQRPYNRMVRTEEWVIKKMRQIFKILKKTKATLLFMEIGHYHIKIRYEY